MGSLPSFPFLLLERGGLPAFFLITSPWAFLAFFFLCWDRWAAWPSFAFFGFLCASPGPLFLRLILCNQWCRLYISPRRRSCLSSDWRSASFAELLGSDPAWAICPAINPPMLTGGSFSRPVICLWPHTGPPFSFLYGRSLVEVNQAILAWSFSAFYLFKNRSNLFKLLTEPLVPHLWVTPSLLSYLVFFYFDSSNQCSKSEIIYYRSLSSN